MRSAWGKISVSRPDNAASLISSLSLLLFLRPLDQLLLLVATVALSIAHIRITVALVIFVVFFSDIRFRFGLEVFIDAFIVFIGTTTMNIAAIVT